MLGEWREAQRKLRALLQERSDFHVYFSRSQVASALWDYGEDDLAARAISMAELDLRNVQTIASHYEAPEYPLPVLGQRISHNHVIALAAVTYFEGAVRPLSRTRRRSEKDRPEQYTPHT